MKTPEKSVDEIMEELDIKFGEDCCDPDSLIGRDTELKLVVTADDVAKWIEDNVTPLLQAERQKREEVVEAISKSWYKADDVEIRYGFIKSAEYRIKLQALTQPNNK